MMRRVITYLFERHKKPRRGLLPAEWVTMAYLVATMLLMFFLQTKVVNPESMLMGRVRIVATTAAMWAIYRMLPCRLTHLARIVVQMVLLSWWYPDTYEFNRLFTNHDPLFASMDQQLFGCQPALLFSQVCPQPLVSELMNLGYWSYFPMIVAVTLFYFLCRYDELDREACVVLASFFLYYVIFIALPVTGPQFYYVAAGLDNVAAGVFPDVGTYFMTHQEMLPSPGWADGLFYQLVEDAHAAGERPTAAFPSSHVGISTILLFLAWHARNRRLLLGLLPFYVLLCLSTVYIQAHYAVDVLGGWVSAVLVYGLTMWGYKLFGDVSYGSAGSAKGMSGGKKKRG